MPIVLKYCINGAFTKRHLKDAFLNNIILELTCTSSHSDHGLH